MSKEDRKDFKDWQVEIVYRVQDGACLKCGRSLAYGFHRHHKDGDPSNNSTRNLELYCQRCHGGEQYNTLLEKKKTKLGELEALIQMGIEGKVSGAALDKLVDAIRLALSLEEQIADMVPEKPPARIRMEAYLESSGILIKWYERGYLKGLEVGGSNK